MHLFVVDDEEAETLIKELFSNGRIPDNNEPNYKELGVTSDDDMSRIAFHEMGQVLLKKNEDGCYDVDTTILGTFEVRTGFVKYGARAVFDENQKLLEIFVSYLNRTLKPSDREVWEHAKFLWRCSLKSYVTMSSHLVNTHMTISNVGHIAARTSLGATHPIRRVLKVFLFDAGKFKN